MAPNTASGPGAQVTIVTQSGTNQLHGSVYEFLRNNALDAPNYFDQGSAPPFQRNQFGASLGGPIQTDKTFFFANYEGFIQNLHQTSAAFVPDLASRAAAVPSVQPLLNLWITPPANAPDFNGIAQVFSSPLQTIRENFGNARVDHVFSPKDTFSAAYTIDDGNDFTPTTANPYSTDILTLREQVASLEETHVFSPTLLNVARFGYSRAGYFFTGEPTPGTPAASVPGFPAGGSGRRSRGRWQRGVESAGAGRVGGQQQRQQSDRRPQHLHLRRPRELDARQAPVQLRRLGAAVPIERNHRAQPVRAGDLRQPADVPQGNHRLVPVRSCSHRDELALVVYRRLCAGCHSPDPEPYAQPGLPRRIFHGMERGSRARSQLHLP